MGDRRYGWEMARRKGEVSSKARHVEARRLDNAAHRKRLIVVDAGRSTGRCSVSYLRNGSDK